MISLLTTVVLLAQLSSPSPAATSSPAQCAVPNKAAEYIEKVVPARSDSIALTTPVFVLVEVDIGADGTLKKASIYRSSGHIELDIEALNAVRASRFSPQIRNCIPVESVELSKIEFAP